MGDLLGDLPGSVVGGGALGTLVAVAVWLIYTGRLLPRRVYDDIKRERDDWKKAAELRGEQTNQLAAQIGTLLEQGKATERAMLGLSTLVQRIHDSRDDDNDDRHEGHRR